MRSGSTRPGSEGCRPAPAPGPDRRRRGTQRLSLTEAGRAGKAEIKQLVNGGRAQVHEEVTDEEYVAALKVLRRMTANARQATQPWQ